MVSTSFICGRCGDSIEVKDSSPTAELLVHGKTCSRRVERASPSEEKDDVDRTLRVRTGPKDRRKH